MKHREFYQVCRSSNQQVTINHIATPARALAYAILQARLIGRRYDVAFVARYQSCSPDPFVASLLYSALPDGTVINLGAS